MPSIDRRHAAIGMLNIQAAGADDLDNQRQKLGGHI